MTGAEITSQALALPLPQREALARQLWDSINEKSPTELTEEDEAALVEADRRDDELERGTVKPMSHEEFLAAVQKAVECD